MAASLDKKHAGRGTGTLLGARGHNYTMQARCAERRKGNTGLPHVLDTQWGRYE